MRTTLGPGTLWVDDGPPVPYVAAMLDISDALTRISADFRLLSGTLSMSVPVTEEMAATWARLMEEDWRARWYVTPEAAWWEQDRA